MRTLLFVFQLVFFVFTVKAQPEGPAHEKEITAIKYSKNGKFLLSAGKDLKVRLWDLKMSQMIYATDADFIPRKIFISPDNQYFIITQNAGKNILYDFKTGTKLKALQVKEIKGFSPDGKSVITASYGSEGNKEFAVLGFANLNDEFFTSYFSHSKIYFEKELKNPVVAHDKTTILLPHQKKILLFKKDSPGAERSLKIDKQADILAILPNDTGFIINGSKKIFSWKKEKPVPFFEEPTFQSEVSAIAINNYTLVNSIQNKIKIYSLKTGQVIKRLNIEDSELTTLSPKGDTYTYVKNRTTLIVNDVRENLSSTVLQASDLIEKTAYRHYLTGVYYFNYGSFNQAKNYFNKTESLSKSIGKLYFLRGITFQKIGQHEKAIGDFLIDHTLKPGRATYKLAQSFAILGEEKEAVKWLDSCEKYGIKVSKLKLLEDSYFDNIRLRKAFRDKISGYKSGEEIKLARHSKEMLEKNQKLAALEFINQAVKIAPEIPELYNQRARVYTELNENSKARTDLLTAAKLAPFEKAKFFIEVAKAFSRSGEIDSTVFWIKKAISTDSSYIDALVDMAEIYEANFNTPAALSTLNQYLEMVPVNHYAVFLRASLMPMPEVALEEIKKAIKLCNAEGTRVPKAYKELLSKLSNKTTPSSM